MPTIDPRESQPGAEAVHDSTSIDKTSGLAADKPTPTQGGGGSPPEQPRGHRSPGPDFSGVLNLFIGAIGAITTAYVTTQSVPITIIAALVALMIVILVIWRK